MSDYDFKIGVESVDNDLFDKESNKQYVYSFVVGHGKLMDIPTINIYMDRQRMSDTTVTSGEALYLPVGLAEELVKVLTIEIEHQKNCECNKKS